MILRRDHPVAQVVVPDHQELDRGTLRAILRQAGFGKIVMMGLCGQRLTIPLTINKIRRRSSLILLRALNDPDNHANMAIFSSTGKKYGISNHNRSQIY